MNQPTFFPPGDGPGNVQPVPWQARVPAGSTHDLEAMHRQAAEDLAGLDQTIARLEAQTTQAHTDKRAADIRVRRLGELMDELRGMSAAPVAPENLRPVAEPVNRAAPRQRRWHLAVAAVVVVLAACALMVIQSTHGGTWHSFLSHAANRIQSGSVSLR